MRPHVDVDTDDAAFADQFAKARRKNERPAMGDSGLDDYVRLQRKHGLLVAEHVVRQLDDRNPEPGECIIVFLIPADLEPKVLDQSESFIRIERNSLAV